MSDSPANPDVGVTTKPRQRDDTSFRLLPPYNVIILDDDYHSADFVAAVLRKVLNCTEQRAWQLMETAHDTGRAIIWTGSKEVAELKAEQVHGICEFRGGVKLGPLGCTIEPAAGG